MKTRDVLRLLLLAAIWGASFLFMRVAAPVLGALPTASVRVVLGALGLLAIVGLMRVPRDFRGKLPKVLLLGVLNSGVPFAMYGWAARRLPAGYSAIFNATTPLMAVLIGALFFRERMTPAKAGGVVLGLLGVVVLTGAGPVALDANLVLGAAACMVSTICYGLAGFLTRRWITDTGGLDSRLVALGSQVGATMALLPPLAVSLLLDPPTSRGGPPVWLSLLGLGLLCTALAYVLYFRLIADIGPVRALTVTFLIPLFGVLWGLLFLYETLTWAYAAGGALIGLAVWLVLKPPVAPQRGAPRDSGGMDPGSRAAIRIPTS